jgi:hypothetical protein
VRSSDEQFRKNLEIARVEEKRVASWLMKRGWRILPVYDFSGLQEDKAPKLQAYSASDSLVLPDLLCARAGVTKWVEVKWKTDASMTTITRRLETGISLRLWRNYIAASDVSGIEVWIAFVHKNQHHLTLNSLSELKAKNGLRVSPKGPDMGGSVFWPLEELREVSKWPPDDLRQAPSW